MKYLYKNWRQLPWATLHDSPAVAAIPKVLIHEWVMAWFTSGFT